ncbi:MAG: hypothetical protein PHQ65_07565 [Bacteroidales bacterium]|nr:hypothetical protein [Bacteroidales bacterium]MDD3665106.1 hypothetical protein [Bacteroidales bacterium]
MITLPCKRLFVEACLVAVNSRVEDARKAMADAQHAANEYGQPRDRYDSFRTQVLSRRDMYARQYDEALKQLELLKRINPDEEYSTVQFGAVVRTSSQVLFIATGLGKLSVAGVDFFAISTQVPLFQALKGLKKGGSVQFMGNGIEVLSVI